MADDGLVINFELGGTSIAGHAKVKGGRWRDRVKAKRTARTEAEPKAAGGIVEESPGAAEKQPGVSQESGRPTKRQRIERSREDEGSRQGRSNGVGNATSSTGAPPPGTGRQITSRLFTSNPTPSTNFEVTRQDETESTQPSNAPLSEETENFLALGLSLRLAHHLSSKLALKAPTAIQKSTIPQLITGDSDAFLQAETGSGKTLAYLLPIVQRIMALSHAVNGDRKEAKIHRHSGLFAVILAPTRELCKQISVVLGKLLQCAPWLVSSSVIGGESKKSEKARLRKGVNILIATPGRLTDHLDHTRVLDVGTVRWLVLDEGDRLMELGFEDDIKTIVGRIRKESLKSTNEDGVSLNGALPSRRVTVLCSATMKMNVQKLGEISLQDAVHITAPRSTAGGKDDHLQTAEGVFSAPSQLKQSYLVVPAKLRLVTLIALLRSVFLRRGSVTKAIVFISCADSVDFHFDLLQDPEKGQQATKDASSDTIPSLAAATTAEAAYITSPANPKVTLHRLHGSLKQQVRTSTLASFTLSKDPAVLITTDISSRGLDVPAVDLVIEYDPAFAVDDHVHRVGRTARAGRAGRAVLFLQPGCEEGYVSLLGTSANLTPQLYDTVLQKGFSSPIDLAKSSSPPDQKGAQDTTTEKQSYNARAEALQLHLEQRLLSKPDSVHEAQAPREASAATSQRHAKNPTRSSKPRAKEPENALLVAARSAFRSHIRAYATHVREERGFFDMSQLHLGHMAKAFALREAPAGIGGGAGSVGRRLHKAANTSSTMTGSRSSRGSGVGAGSSGADADESMDLDNSARVDAARRMREKMKQTMNAASEFNIG